MPQYPNGPALPPLPEYPQGQHPYADEYPWRTPVPRFRQQEHDYGYRMPGYDAGYQGPATERIPAYIPVRMAAPRRRRRVFPWVFLAVQGLFVIWLIAGLAGTSGSGAQAHTQAVASCSGSQWHPLFKSYDDCVTHYGGALNDASDIGKTIGAGLIIGLWVAVDFITGTSYLIYRLARRHS